MRFTNEIFREERALFGERGVLIENCRFEVGESPVKECSDVSVVDSVFGWKYPLWYCKGVSVDRSTLSDGARAGVWYTDDAAFANTAIDAPKCFRRCHGLSLENVTIPNAAETLWSCDGVKMKNVKAAGDYFAMNCKNVEVDNLDLDGNYAFDGVENLAIRNSNIITKDAFWNSKYVTVYDSYIKGEYLAWNAENVTLVDCTVESLQALCYIQNLKLVRCKLINTSLAFERSTVDADIVGSVDSVFDPASGVVRADRTEDLVNTDTEKTRIICDNIDKISDEPDWSKIL